MGSVILGSLFTGGAILLLFSVICWRMDRQEKNFENEVLCHLPEAKREGARADLQALAHAIFAVKIFRRNPPVRISGMGGMYENWREEPTVLACLEKYQGCPGFAGFSEALVSYLNNKWYERDAMRYAGMPGGGGWTINNDHG